METPAATRRANPFLGTFLNMLYIIYFAPFKLVKCKKSNEYVIIKPRVSSVVSAFVHIIILVLSIIRALGSIARYVEIRHDISTTFYLASKLGSIGGLCALQWILWRNQEGIQRFIQMTSAECSANKVVRSQVLAIAIFLLITSASTVCASLSGMNVLNLNGINHVLDRTVSPLTSFLFGHDLVDIVRQCFSTYVQSTVILKRILSIVAFVACHFIISTMLILAFTFKFAVNEMFRCSIRGSYGDIAQFIKIYGSLKEMAILGNELFGPFILGYYIAALSFFAELPHLVLVNSGDVVRFCMGIFFVAIFGALVIASGANKQIEKDLRKYVSFHHWQQQWDTKEHLQLIALTQDMEAEPIALSCSYFAITRKFISSTLGLLITYGILVFQMTGNEIAFWEDTSKPFSLNIFNQTL